MMKRALPTNVKLVRIHKFCSRDYKGKELPKYEVWLGERLLGEVEKHEVRHYRFSGRLISRTMYATEWWASCRGDYRVMFKFNKSRLCAVNALVEYSVTKVW